MDGMAGAGAIIPELAGFAPEFRRSKRLLLAAAGAGLAAGALVVGADWKSSKSSGVSAISMNENSPSPPKRSCAGAGGAAGAATGAGSSSPKSNKLTSFGFSTGLACLGVVFGGG